MTSRLGIDNTILTTLKQHYMSAKFYFETILTTFPNSGIKLCPGTNGHYHARVIFYNGPELKLKVLVFDTDACKTESAAIRSLMKFLYTEENYYKIARCYTKE
jgi:hypothetical protein